MLRRNSCVTATPMDAKAREVLSHARNVRSRKKIQNDQPIGFLRDMQLSCQYARCTRYCDTARYATYQEPGDLWPRFPCFPAAGTEICEKSPSSMTTLVLLVLLRPPRRRLRFAAAKTDSGFSDGSQPSSPYRCMKLFSDGLHRRYRRFVLSGSPAKALLPSLRTVHCRWRDCGKSFSGEDSKRRDPWFLPVVKPSALSSRLLLATGSFSAHPRQRKWQVVSP